ncbi:MAG: hypothetical protein OEM15_16885 [Myxococcales bacterium]|nr:hypothetical protein [Myxococcales bacterium]MDH3482766.1 hypothetical protein [Myxococcales bacterium]
MKLVIALGKVIALTGWAWGLLSLLTPTMVPAPEIGRMVLLGLLAVHVAETIAFAKNLASETGKPVVWHARQIMIFGYFHVMGVRYNS